MVTRPRLRSILTALGLYAIAAALIVLFRRQCLYRQPRTARAPGHRCANRRTDQRTRSDQGRARAMAAQGRSFEVGRTRSGPARRARAGASRLCRSARRHHACAQTLTALARALEELRASILIILYILLRYEPANRPSALLPHGPDLGYAQVTTVCILPRKSMAVAKKKPAVSTARSGAPSKKPACCPAAKTPPPASPPQRSRRMPNFPASRN